MCFLHAYVCSYVFADIIVGVHRELDGEGAAVTGDET